MEVVLAIFRPGAERFSFALANDVTVIGRQIDCDLRISILDVSRKHCRLIKEDQILEIEDLGSSNGTFLNGRKVSSAMVSAGDVIQVGPVRFVVQIDGEPTDEEIANNIETPAATEVAAEEVAPIEDDTEEPDDLIDFNLDEPPGSSEEKS